MKTATSLMLIVLLAGFTGCGSDSTTSDGGTLEGGQWRLTAWTVSSVNPADYAISAVFADGQISGHSGVNSYSGPCNVGPGSALTVGSIMSTMIGGTEEDVSAEATYVTLLGLVKSYRVTAQQLILYDANNTAILIFNRADS